MKANRNRKAAGFLIPHILLALVVALVVRLFLSPLGTYESDFNTFVAWSNRLVALGFGKFYEVWSDYLPGYLYILWFLGQIKDFVPISQTLLFKLPAILSDVVTGFIIYSIVKKVKNKRLGAMAASLYVFNPAVLANSTLWGQVDSLTALFSLAAIWLVDKSFIFSSLTLAFGTLIKPQVALAAGVILFVMLKNKWQSKEVFLYVAFAFTLFVLGFIPFTGGKNIALFILERLQVTFNQYPYTSVNAFNFWGLFGFWNEEVVPLSPLGFVITGLTALLFFIKQRKIKDSRYFLASLIFVSSFMFFTRMHERHLLFAFAPLAVVSAQSSTSWLPYIVFSATYVANLYYSYNWVSNRFISTYPPIVIMTKILIILNLAFFIFLLFAGFKRTIGKGWKNSVITKK